MYIVTGGAGFIGSAMVWKLNTMGIDDILVVDSLGRGDKWRNLVNRRFADYMDKAEFVRRIKDGPDSFGAKAVFHMGACSATTELDAAYLIENNYRYSLEVARYCLSVRARLISASSAATYGDGAQGFDDDHQALDGLRPMNMYGYSKHLFDLAARRNGWLGKLASLKFFNVYGPNEYHKGTMRSVVCKAFEQITDTGTLGLFKSYRQGFADGGQRRDFIYVKDCVNVMYWLLEHPEANGIFNVGTGEARSFDQLGAAVFTAMDHLRRIEYIDMPEAIRDTYQYHTEAKMDRLRQAGYDTAFTPLEKGVRDYVQGYLGGEDRYL